MRRYGKPRRCCPREPGGRQARLDRRSSAEGFEVAVMLPIASCGRDQHRDRELALHVRHAAVLDLPPRVKMNSETSSTSPGRSSPIAVRTVRPSMAQRYRTPPAADYRSDRRVPAARKRPPWRHRISSRRPRAGRSRPRRCSRPWPRSSRLRTQSATRSLLRPATSSSATLRSAARTTSTSGAPSGGGTTRRRPTTPPARSRCAGSWIPTARRVDARALSRDSNLPDERRLPGCRAG